MSTWIILYSIAAWGSLVVLCRFARKGWNDPARPPIVAIGLLFLIMAAVWPLVLSYAVVISVEPDTPQVDEAAALLRKDKGVIATAGEDPDRFVHNMAKIFGGGAKP